MGISPFREYFNMRSDQFPWETLAQDPVARPEKERVQLRATAEATVERVVKELDALLPPKLGESSTNQPKEGETERDDEVFARFSEFMKGGGCKESFTALADCVMEIETITKCSQHLPKLIKCVDAHSDYYQPIIALAESTVEQIVKGFEEEEAARKHAKRWLRRFW